MYAQAAIKRNPIRRNGATGIVMRDVQKCTRGCSSLRGRKRLPLCCIKLETATDSPCGGGKGMILRFDTTMKALEGVRREKSRVILLTPKGQVYSQKKARELSKEDDIVLICGHYEGVDRRVENHVDDMISIGDYVLSSGETAAEVIVDSIVRLLDGVIRDGATEDESHENLLLEYPQYTKPAEYMGERVPDILLSGNHQKIEEWKHIEALKDTKRLRPDLFEKYPLGEEERRALDES